LDNRDDICFLVMSIVYLIHSGLARNEMLDFFSSSYGVTLIQVAILNIVALVSPGPDFAIVVRNSLAHSRRAGLMTAAGITAGETVHISYILLGVGVVIAKTLWLLTTIKIAGCLYLTYLGIQLLRAKKEELNLDVLQEVQPAVNNFKAFQTGAATNILNPKAILFFISIFSVVVDSNTPLSILMLYGVVMLVSTFTWFSIVALFFSNAQIRNRFVAVKHWIDRITGGLLIAISIKLALTKEY